MCVCVCVCVFDATTIEHFLYSETRILISRKIDRQIDILIDKQTYKNLEKRQYRYKFLT